MYSVRRVHLKRKIATIHRVEKIEADRKLGSKTRMYRLAQ